MNNLTNEEFLYKCPPSPCTSCANDDSTCKGCPKKQAWDQEWGTQIQERRIVAAAQVYWEYALIRRIEDDLAYLARCHEKTLRAMSMDGLVTGSCHRSLLLKEMQADKPQATQVTPTNLFEEDQQ